MRAAVAAAGAWMEYWSARGREAVWVNAHAAGRPTLGLVALVAGGYSDSSLTVHLQPVRLGEGVVQVLVWTRRVTSSGDRFAAEVAEERSRFGG